MAPSRLEAPRKLSEVADDCALLSGGIGITAIVVDPGGNLARSGEADRTIEVFPEIVQRLRRIST